MFFGLPSSTVVSSARIGVGGFLAANLGDDTSAGHVTLYSNTQRGGYLLLCSSSR